MNIALIYQYHGAKTQILNSIEKWPAYKVARGILANFVVGNNKTWVVRRILSAVIKDVCLISGV